jgi:hypothetical protein
VAGIAQRMTDAARLRVAGLLRRAVTEIERRMQGAPPARDALDLQTIEEAQEA